MYILLDVAIPAVRNVVQKKAENKLKYKSLCIEIQWMWNLKCKNVPVINWATGKVTKGLRKNLEAIPLKPSIDSLIKTAVLGISHIIQIVLQFETWSLSSGDHRWFKRTARKKWLVTRDKTNNSSSSNKNNNSSSNNSSSNNNNNNNNNKIIIIITMGP